MRIQGLQKLTLLDFPGKMACTVFTAGCNLRCPFCHNASLVLRPEENVDFSEEEIFQFLKKRTGILDGVCITGGEPMLQPDLEDFIRKVKALGYLVKLDTNGTFPERLQKLMEEGLLDYVAMDIKSSKEGYGAAVGIADYDTKKVEESAALLKEGRVPYEFRTTVVRGLHKGADFEAIGRWLSGAEQYYLQGFVDSGDVIGTGYEAFSREEMERFLALVRKEVPKTSLRGL